MNYRLNNEKDNHINATHFGSKFYQVFFGDILNYKELRDMENINIQSLVKFICLFTGTYCIQGWKTCKWFEIRDKTPGKFNSSALRFYKYIQVREKEDIDEMKLVQIAESKDSKKVKKMMEKSVANDLIKMEGKRYDSGNVTKKARRDTSFL